MPRHRLSKFVQVRAYHSGDLGVAAGGAAVSQQDNGLTVAGDLDSSKGGAVGNNIRPFHMLDGRPLQPVAHSVRLHGHRILGAQEGLQAGPGKSVILWTKDNPYFVLAAITPAEAGRGLPGDERGLDISCLQHVAGHQSPALETADGSLQVGGAAAHNHRHVDASGDGQVSPHAVLRPLKAQNVVLGNLRRAPESQGLAIQLRAEIGPRQGYPGFRKKAYLGAKDRHLQAGFAVGVAHQGIADAQREDIHRPGNRHAEPLETVPSSVLHRGQQSRLDYFNGRSAHLAASVTSSRSPASASLFISSYSSMPTMGVNRT